MSTMTKREMVVCHAGCEKNLKKVEVVVRARESRVKRKRPRSVVYGMCIFFVCIYSISQ